MKLTVEVARPDYDIEAMSKEKLLDLRPELETERQRLEDHLASGKPWLTGIGPIPPVRAEYKRLGRLIQQIGYRIAALNGVQKAENKAQMNFKLKTFSSSTRSIGW